MEVVRKTVPSSGSGVTKAALSKLGSASAWRRRRYRRIWDQVDCWNVQLSEHSQIGNGWQVTLVSYGRWRSVAWRCVAEELCTPFNPLTLADLLQRRKVKRHVKLLRRRHRHKWLAVSRRIDCSMYSTVIWSRTASVPQTAAVTLWKPRYCDSAPFTLRCGLVRSVAGLYRTL